MQKLIELVARLLHGVLNAINRKKAQDAQDNVADNLSNGGNVMRSDKTFAELSGKVDRDRVE